MMWFEYIDKLTYIKKIIFEKKIFLHFLISTVRKEEYEVYSGILQEAGIDYRVNMRTDTPTLVRLRFILEDPVRYRIQYDFYVRWRDLKRARHALKAVTRRNKTFGNLY